MTIVGHIVRWLKYSLAFYPKWLKSILAFTSITREPFLFYEMRVTAKLLSQGASDEEALMQIVGENLFQYPTEKTIRKIARSCMIRLHGLNDDSLIAAVAQQPQDEAKQLCLYALMKQHRLVADFMLTVIGDK